MECPRCGASNPTGASRCAKCDAPLAPASSKGLSGESQSIRTAGEGETSDLDIFSVVHPGAVLGGRYEILELLGAGDRKSTRLNSSHVRISYAVFCLKKKKNIITPRLD